MLNSLANAASFIATATLTEDAPVAIRLILFSAATADAEKVALVPVSRGNLALRRKLIEKG